MANSRPVLHYTPPSGWVNDPLALTHHEGRWHLFFQYVPGSTVWDVACRWGHATSEDLLAWHTEPVSLEPDDDEDGVWSGSLVRDRSGEALVFYTAVDAGDADDGRVRLARPADRDWTAWHKGEVVLGRPGGGARAFRDPFVTAYDDGWRMLLAGGLDDGTGVLWSSRSSDLGTWSEPVVAASGRDLGTLWECPSVLRVDGRSVLVISVGGPQEQHSVAYAWCEDHGDRIDVGEWHRLTYGPSLYAASGFTEPTGEPGVIAWLRGVGDVEAGWMGAHTLPYRLHARGEVLVARPHPAVHARREGGVLDGLLPSVCDIAWEPRPGDFLVARDQFRLDAAGEVVAVTVADARHELPWSGEPVRVVLDGPVLEVFGDGGVLALPVPATGHDGVLTGSTERARVHRLAAG